MKTIQLAIRLPAELIQSVDREAKRLESTSSGVRVTRSDAVRFLVRKGLESCRVAKAPKARASPKSR